ncbi:MAG: DUF1203 domain-containing protein [Xanthomonadales bacterium]|nr:DUF1203 domain-containing protein [Xanthomonadales bacterium]
MSTPIGFRVKGLDPRPYRHLYGQPEAMLADQGVHRITATEHGRYPDRASLQDAQPGQALLLLNHCHLERPSPYAATHAIYLREGECEVAQFLNRLPPAWQGRTLAIRAIDARQWIVQARLVEFDDASEAINELLTDPTVTHLHAHYPATGCLAARIERAGDVR